MERENHCFALKTLGMLGYMTSFPLRTPRRRAPC